MNKVNVLDTIAQFVVSHKSLTVLEKIWVLIPMMSQIQDDEFKTCATLALIDSLFDAFLKTSTNPDSPLHIHILSEKKRIFIHMQPLIEDASKMWTDDFK